MSEGKRLRVGFAAGDWQRWLGGVNYYRSLLSAILGDPEGGLDPILFVGHRLDPSLAEGFPEVPRVRSQIFDRGSPMWLARAVGRRAFARDPLFERLLGANRVRVVSHLNQPWRTTRRSIIGWIPDLQHFRLPENFSADEHRMRNRQFKQTIRLSTLVIVSSEASRQDLAEFSRLGASKARVLHFVPELPRTDELPSGDELARRYGFNGPYFHLPNQFWVHKNHELVIQALSELKRRGVSALVIATGEPTAGSGRPDRHDSLLRTVRELGLSDHFRSLGVVSYRDMVGLMGGSVAVINPSRFEGWSTTIEEAKCLGKRVLCSDLAVHREQDAPGARFFDPDDPAELADAMAQTLRDAADPDVNVGSSASDARAAAQERRRLFAREFTEIVEEAYERLDHGKAGHRA